jgi:hypothetical protein
MSRDISSGHSITLCTKVTTASGAVNSPGGGRDGRVMSHITHVLYLIMLMLMNVMVTFLHSAWALSISSCSGWNLEVASKSLHAPQMYRGKRKARRVYLNPWR